MTDQPPLTAQELTSFITALTKKQTAPEREPAQYCFVLYARKSSDDERHQQRSLPEQVAECLEYAERNKLNIIETITEAESAKEPDIRPKFRQMLADFRDGKYDGIVAWHPDRLARNMKEAGEIIDFLDKKIIKDLKFVTVVFNNDTAGITTLGIMFVLSKQYSDALSTNVKRGNLRSVLQGKWLHTAKLGYYKDPNQLLRPDGNNFHLVREAWEMRLQNKTLSEIEQHLNGRGLTKAQKQTRVICNGVHVRLIANGYLNSLLTPRMRG
jgi:site-specific DNA recombinase